MSRKAFAHGAPLIPHGDRQRQHGTAAATRDISSAPFARESTSDTKVLTPSVFVSPTATASPRRLGWRELN